MLLNDPILLTLACFTCGLLLGVVLHRGEFCMAGIFRDIFLLNDFTMLRPLLLAVLSTMLLFALAGFTGLVPPGPPPSLPDGVTLMAGAGGILFGLGMVLSGGCVVGTLYKMGAGSLSSFIAFWGIVAGSLLYAHLHPSFLALAQSMEFCGPTTLTQLWPKLAPFIVWLLPLLFFPFFKHWLKQGKLSFTDHAVGYIQPWITALALAFIQTIYYIVTTTPLGISTAYAKISFLLASPLAPEHVSGLSYFNRPSLLINTENGPLSGGPGPGFGLIFQSEMGLLAGIVAGSMLSAIALKEFAFHGWPPFRQGVGALLGGVLMALGARVASGCNVKFVLGGLPLLSLQAMLFVGGMLAGAAMGTWALTRLIIR